MSPIPITVFTGFLGAGKTSVILSLVERLPKEYKVVLLKNEFGDVEVDSKLAKQSALSAVSEILNGCMCCVLVGQMQTALLEIRDNFRPDRIIIECSGSAFPATLAFQIRQLEKDTGGDFELDGIVTVIDAENFVGYEDTSPTAKMQASYSDVILINKWEHVTEHALDVVLDHLYTLNEDTPKIKCQGRNGVDPQLIFGLESKLFMTENKESDYGVKHDEVETITVVRGQAAQQHGGCEHTNHEHTIECGADQNPVDKETLVNVLNGVPKDIIWRVKGFVKTVDGQWWLVNWAFGRHGLVEYSGDDIEGTVKLTLMGARGEVVRNARKVAAGLGGSVLN
ncbi:CobW/HypB/UreG, nucleotide-binding domain-containing protein [Panaeolus papilionaceus]|nr:CobW/HypB/UreG, nucleotide-binding domain-containing protein [Panaeolus papilionaceus]